MSEDVGQFFDSLTDGYTETIERCFPRYREMLWTLMDYLPTGRSFGSVLELGCGTGNLSVAIHDAFPQASDVAWNCGSVRGVSVLLNIGRTTRFRPTSLIPWLKTGT